MYWHENSTKKIFTNLDEKRKFFKSSRQYTTFLWFRDEFYCVHVFAVIHKFSKIANFICNFLENDNNSIGCRNAKNASFFMNFPNIHKKWKLFFQPEWSFKDLCRSASGTFLRLGITLMGLNSYPFHHLLQNRTAFS